MKKKVNSGNKKYNMKICPYCGHEIAESARMCPNCGAKNGKPIYKRTWIVVLVMIIGLLLFEETMHWLIWCIVILGLRIGIEIVEKRKNLDTCNETVYTTEGCIDEKIIEISTDEDFDSISTEKKDETSNSIRYCENCGRILETDQVFCAFCGCKAGFRSKVEKESIYGDKSEFMALSVDTRNLGTIEKVFILTSVLWVALSYMSNVVFLFSASTGSVSTKNIYYLLSSILMGFAKIFGICTGVSVESFAFLLMVMIALLSAYGVFWGLKKNIRIAIVTPATILVTMLVNVISISYANYIGTSYYMGITNKLLYTLEWIMAVINAICVISMLKNDDYLNAKKFILKRQTKNCTDESQTAKTSEVMSIHFEKSKEKYKSLGEKIFKNAECVKERLQNKRIVNCNNKLNIDN